MFDNDLDLWCSGGDDELQACCWSSAPTLLVPLPSDTDVDDDECVLLDDDKCWGLLTWDESIVLSMILLLLLLLPLTSLPSTLTRSRETTLSVSVLTTSSSSSANTSFFTSVFTSSSTVFSSSPSLLICWKLASFSLLMLLLPLWWPIMSDSCPVPPEFSSPFEITLLLSLLLLFSATDVVVDGCSFPSPSSCKDISGFSLNNRSQSGWF